MFGFVLCKLIWLIMGAGKKSLLQYPQFDTKQGLHSKKICIDPHDHIPYKIYSKYYIYKGLASTFFCIDPRAYNDLYRYANINIFTLQTKHDSFQFIHQCTTSTYCSINGSI